DDGGCEAGLVDPGTDRQLAENATQHVVRRSRTCPRYSRGPTQGRLVRGEGEAADLRGGAWQQDLHRRVPLRRRPITQLAVVVVSPGPSRPVALERHAMKAIGGDCGDAAQAGDLDPRCPQRHRAVTYLAGVVAAPSPDRPVAPERQAVSLTA